MWCGVIVLRISLSRILTGLHNNEIGIYDVGSVGVLFGLSMSMILPLLFSRYVECCWALLYR